MHQVKWKSAVERRQVAKIMKYLETFLTKLLRKLHTRPSSTFTFLDLAEARIKPLAHRNRSRCLSTAGDGAAETRIRGDISYFKTLIFWQRSFTGATVCTGTWERSSPGGGYRAL